MKVAILHNPRPEHPDAPVPDDAFEEYDSQETIAAIAAALAGLRVDAVPVVADRRLPWRLEESRFDFVFNIAEGTGRRCREAIPAAVCELLGIPFTGSDALTLAVTLDKSVARRIVAPDVPVAPGVLVAAEGDEPQLASLRYPVLVKPNDEGSSKGIRDNPICRDRAAAAERCRWLRDRYQCPALVEELLTGMEVTVGVWGNSGGTVLGVMDFPYGGVRTTVCLLDRSKAGFQATRPLSCSAAPAGGYAARDPGLRLDGLSAARMPRPGAHRLPARR
jgi:D-alanine-D-alanine ligase-like ATP-grasp enzyme